MCFVCFVVRLVFAVWKSDWYYKIAPVQPMTLVSFLLFAPGSGIGLLLG
jgi:hypothetical protein